MSRHYIPTTNPGTTVVVGYDRPLRYLFATVFPRNRDPIELTGIFTGVQTISELAAAVQPYATLPATVRAMLEDERRGTVDANRTMDHRPQS